MKTYLEMNEKVADILRHGDKIEQYAAQYIEELRKENAELKHRAEVAEKLASARKEAVKKFANTLTSKIPCHSYYYGDSIVSAIYVLAGGREIKNVKPVNISEFHTQELERKLKEAEHRAEVAERALKECSKRLSVFTKSFGDGATEEEVYNKMIKIAEKELSEETKCKG